MALPHRPCLLLFGRYEDARKAFEVADLDPGDEDTLEFLEWIRNKTAPQPAKEPLRCLIRTRCAEFLG